MFYWHRIEAPRRRVGVNRSPQKNPQHAFFVSDRFNRIPGKTVFGGGVLLLRSS
jgi:hypothetical protein